MSLPKYLFSIYMTTKDKINTTIFANEVDKAIPTTPRSK